MLLLLLPIYWSGLRVSSRRRDIEGGVARSQPFG